MNSSKDNDEQGNICELFGLTDERADEIAKAFRHAHIDTDKWTDCFSQTVKAAKVKELSEAYYLGWFFRAQYKKNDMKSLLFEKLLSNLE
jgi:hypothetical protein